MGRYLMSNDLIQGYSPILTKLYKSALTAVSSLSQSDEV